MTITSTLKQSQIDQTYAWAKKKGLDVLIDKCVETYKESNVQCPTFEEVNSYRAMIDHIHEKCSTDVFHNDLIDMLSTNLALIQFKDPSYRLTD